MKPVFLFGNLNDNRTKIIDLPSFQLVTRINSQNRNETEFINVLWHIICIWILVIPIGIIEVSTPRIWIFLFYFICLHDFRTPSTWTSSCHSSWGKKERCEKRAFQLLKMLKENQLKHKTKCITYFVLTVRSSRMKNYTCHFEVSK